MTRLELPNWFEQVLHFLLLGVALTYALHPSLAIAVLLCREFSKLRIGRWKIGQWPPGSDQSPTIVQDGRLFFAADRVEDLRQDVVFTGAGISVGAVLVELAPWWSFIG